MASLGDVLVTPAGGQANPIAHQIWILVPHAKHAVHGALVYADTHDVVDRYVLINDTAYTNILRGLIRGNQQRAHLITGDAAGRGKTAATAHAHAVGSEHSAVVVQTVVHHGCLLIEHRS